MNERVDLKNVVENGELKICSPAKAKAKGVFPNRIGWVADNPKVAGIVDSSRRMATTTRAARPASMSCARHFYRDCRKPAGPWAATTPAIAPFFD
jgi:hypothetical protein